jgi:putative hemolysin
MNALVVEVIIILVLIIANGVFSMSETAVVSARKARLQQMADEGDSRAGRALELATYPNRFLATVQIGITLIGILTGVFGGATIAAQLAAFLADIPVLAPYSATIAGGIVVVLLTYISLVIGELVPKRLALGAAERIAGAIASPMNALSRLASPVVRLLNLSTDAVIRLLGIKPSQEPVVTPEEINVLIEQGREVGVFEESEQDMIERVLRLDDRRIDTLMTPRRQIVSFDIDATPNDIRRKIMESKHSRFPVVQGDLDNVLGIVRAKDLLAQRLAGQPLDLHNLLRPALFLPESTSALAVLELFKAQGTHVGLVLDEYGSIQGMVTHNDVLEAIVGYDPSEEGPAQPLAVRRADGSWLIDGLAPADDIADLLELAQLPDAELSRYQTVGGLVMSQVSGVPAVGESFEWAGWRFEVVDMDGRRVDKVLAAPISQGSSA